MDNEILNLKLLLKEISKKSPTGEDLRFSDTNKNLYIKLRDLRQAARTIERQMCQGIEPTSQADWNSVCEQAIMLLSAKTKDIEICAWLCEALIRLHGFSGLKNGFNLIHKMIEYYWDKQLYPMPDEEGVYTRVAAFAGLNGNDTDGTLIIPIAKIALTKNTSLGEYSLWQYQQASDLLKLPAEKREQRIAAGCSTMEMIEAAASKTSLEFFEDLVEQINHCLNLYENINAILANKCGDDAPPSSRITNKLKDCLNAVEMISQKSIVPINLEIQGKVQGQDIATKNSIHNISKFENAKIFSERKVVLNNILEAAKYFRQTEPHSPLSYLLEKTVRWGNTPFPELLRELIKDDQSWSNICHLTGIET